MLADGGIRSGLDVDRLLALGAKGVARPGMGVRAGRRRASGRRFKSAGPTTRAKDATLQVAGSGPALRFHPLRDRQFLQYPASPRLRKDNAHLSNRSHGGLEFRVSRCHMNIPFGSASRLGEVNVTIPCWLHLALNAKRKRVCIGLAAPIKEMTLNDSVWHVWAMWLSVHLPRLDSTCASGRLARLHASIGSHLAAGDAFADVTIDLSAGVMRDCPPVTTCRIVLQEPAWLRRVLISPTEPVAGGGLIALFSITPDSPPEDPSRHARANLAMILHHEDWWESER